MNLGAIAKQILSLAETVLPLVGGPGGLAVVGIAKGVIGMIDNTRTVFSETDQAKLQARRDELEEAVLGVGGHADRTIDSLD